MLGRLGFTALAAATLLVTALLGAYLPVLIRSRDKKRGIHGRSLVYVLGNMLSAGVMVSAGFCHLLGEALKQMPAVEFPLAPFLCGVGFLLTLVCDAAAKHATSADPGEDGGVGAFGCHAGQGMPGSNKVSGASGSFTASRDETSGSEVTCDLENGAILGDGGALMHRGAKPGLNGKRQVELGMVGGDEIRHQHLLLKQPGSGNGAGEAAPLLDPTHGSSFSSFSHQQQQQQQQQQLFGPTDDGTPGCTNPVVEEVGGGPGRPSRHVSFVTALLMGVALCFHSVLEGAALGAQATVSASLHVFIAIVSHKGLAAYALGSSIVDSGAPPRKFWSVVLPFALASPVGIAVGFVVSDLATGAGAASLSALASGTFLYVAFMEVIPKELESGGHSTAKLAALATGFGLMSALAIWA